MTKTIEERERVVVRFAFDQVGKDHRRFFELHHREHQRRIEAARGRSMDHRIAVEGAASACFHPAPVGGKTVGAGDFRPEEMLAAAIAFRQKEFAVARAVPERHRQRRNVR